MTIGWLQQILLAAYASGRQQDRPIPRIRKASREVSL